MAWVREGLYFVGVFYMIYLVLFATFALLSVAVGAYKLYANDRMNRLKNKFSCNDLPVSILVPAYNEAVTIVDSVKSLLALDYCNYEIIVVDDGSDDGTAQTLIDAFDLLPVYREIEFVLACRPQEAVFDNVVQGVQVTLVRKQNGGKGDALNMGINLCRHAYFIGVDADSKLQANALTEIVRPVLEDDSVVAAGGMVLVAQCVNDSEEEGDEMQADYRFPPNLLVSLQALEYNRSFLASRILMDTFNGNLIISGAFGLFKKSTVVNAGGYCTDTLGEDMELVLKLHGYCRNNDIKYRMRYQPSAICLTQAPTTMRDLRGQRRRWHLGLLQSMFSHRRMLFNKKFGLVGFFSYLYYFSYELLAPFVELFGLVTILLAFFAGMLNMGYMLAFFVLYGIYGSLISLTAFSQHIYAQNIRVKPMEMLKALLLCVLEFGFFRYVLVVVRILAVFGYGKNKGTWGKIKRV
ncbi:MAG: glycosyltransferase family 2 protein [Oscillospiraceae bacterium]|nr:glycosyltransferase family 2 protein [Oscillospiraceae bacterium]